MAKKQDKTVYTVEEELETVSGYDICGTREEVLAYLSQAFDHHLATTPRGSTVKLTYGPGKYSGENTLAFVLERPENELEKDARLAKTAAYQKRQEEFERKQLAELTKKYAGK